MSSYPRAPEGWAVTRRRSAGPFTTRVSYAHPDGRRLEWSSRRHRKHASRLSRVRPGRDGLLWAPHRASWWIAVLFSATNENGWDVVDAQSRTTVPGVWVAGNAPNPRAQFITAAGEGSSAAIAMNADLVEEDVEEALLALRRGASHFLPTR